MAKKCALIVTIAVLMLVATPRVSRAAEWADLLRLARRLGRRPGCSQRDMTRSGTPISPPTERARRDPTDLVGVTYWSRVVVHSVIGGRTWVLSEHVANHC